jgi:predicted porin
MSHTIKAQLEAFVLEEDEQVDIDTANATFGNANAVILDDELEGAANFVGYDLGMGKTTFTVQVGATVVEGDDNLAAVNDADQETTATYTAVGVTHKFSKKTRVFAGLRTTNIEVDYDDPATYDEEVDVSVFSLGLRKDF